MENKSIENKNMEDINKDKAKINKE